MGKLWLEACRAVMASGLCRFLDDQTEGLDDRILEDEYPRYLWPCKVGLRLLLSFDGRKCLFVECARGRGILDE